MTVTDPPQAPLRGLWVRSFDGVRGFVCLSIALTHVSLATAWIPNHEPFRALRSSMFFSIEYLFLLGGFVAFLPLVVYGRFAGVRTYLLRRAGRILPLYWLTLVLALALGDLLRPVTRVNFPHDPGAVVGHFLFLQQELYPFRAGFGVQGIVWTMSIAALFYAIYPLVVERYLRRPFLGLAIAIGVSVLWRTQTGSNPQLYLQFPLFCVDFALGMTAAHVYVRMSDNATERMRSALRFACPAALVLLLCLMYAAGLPVATGHGALWGESTPLSIAVPLTFGVFLITVPFLPAWGQWVASNRISRWIGSISYAIFLFHFLVIWLVLRFVDVPRNGTPSSMLELTVLVLPITLTLAWLATRYIENPLRLRAQRLAARSQRSPVIEPGSVERGAVGAKAPTAEPEPASSAVH